MTLQTIPYIDLADSYTFCCEREASAAYILEQAVGSLGMFGSVGAKLMMPIADRIAKNFLQRSGNPFLTEINEYARLLDIPGVYALNLSYEWGCTSGAYLLPDGTPLMLRILDWPFAGLGEQVCLFKRKAVSGAYYDLTWPGVSGVYQAMAPGRFSVSVNLAPMRRHGYPMAIDWIKNRMTAFSNGGMPPAHAVRLTLERCATYKEAKQLLSEMPLCVPAIFVLTGVMPGEGCVVERLETEANIREAACGGKAYAANMFLTDFAERGNGWTPREPDNDGRQLRASCFSAEQFSFDNFHFLRPPILNPMTRLAMLADASTGRLSAQGMETYGIATEVMAFTAES